MVKKGQVFLIAALVIVSILIGLGAIYNTVNVSAEDIQIYDLSDEISFEASQVLDSGVFHGTDKGKIEENRTDKGKIEENRDIGVF